MYLIKLVPICKFVVPCSLHIRSQFKSKVFSQEGCQWKIEDGTSANPSHLACKTFLTSIPQLWYWSQRYGHPLFFGICSLTKQCKFLSDLHFNWFCTDTQRSGSKSSDRVGDFSTKPNFGVTGLVRVELKKACIFVGQPSWLKTLDSHLPVFGGRAGVLGVTGDCLRSREKVFAWGAGGWGGQKATSHKLRLESANLFDQNLKHTISTSWSSMEMDGRQNHSLEKHHNV